MALPSRDNERSLKVTAIYYKNQTPKNGHDQTLQNSTLTNNDKR